MLCNRTIRENLLYGCLEEPSDRECREALRMAQCEDALNLWMWPRMA